MASSQNSKLPTRNKRSRTDTFSAMPTLGTRAWLEVESIFG